MSATGNAANPGKEVNINVVVRARPLNARETGHNSKPAVRINPSANVIEVSQQSRQQTKSYMFDKVFNDQVGQELFYKQTVSPIVQDFLTGFNCTLFAYGQTGTGKTYTMIGDQNGVLGDKKAKYIDFSSLPHAGVIPRVSNEIFTTLDSQNADYQVRVSHMEVYCEEIYDLLKDPAEEREALRLFEERPSYGTGNKGHKADDNRESAGLPAAIPQAGDRAGGKLVILGLEEVLVKSPAEIITLLNKSTENRRVAETKMNANSSRSHSIFTICLIVKETAPSSNTNADLDVIRISKMNLVDLAGSESAGKSGATGDRQQEASKINKSLLTLGRVINALIETKQHIPYRESKLTRLLQDSLGGRTKTCIIATITMSDMALDETINTLDYMSRAKRIRNLPEITAKISGKSVLKEYSMEIKRLRELLNAQKDVQGGIFLTTESYDEMAEAARSNKAQVTELEARIQQVTAEMEKIALLFAAETEKVGKLRKTLNTTVNKVTTLHEEKMKLYEKIVTGREKEKSNLSAYTRLKEHGQSSMLEHIFSEEALKKNIDQSGISSALMEIEKTAIACRDELATFQDLLAKSLDEHKRDMTTGLETLVSKLMAPIVRSSVEILSVSIPGVLEDDLLDKLTTILKENFMSSAGASLLSIITEPQIAFAKKLEERAAMSVASCFALSALLGTVSEETVALFATLIQSFQAYVDDDVAFIETLNQAVDHRLKQQADDLKANLQILMNDAVRTVLEGFSVTLDKSVGKTKSAVKDATDARSKQAADAISTIETRWNQKELSKIDTMHTDIMAQLDSLQADVDGALTLLKQNRDTMTSATTQYTTALCEAFDNDVGKPVAAPIAKAIRQLAQIGETLSDMLDAYSTQLSSISTTSHTTLQDKVAQLSQTHICEYICEKFLGEAALDPSTKEGNKAATMLINDLEKSVKEQGLSPQDQGKNKFSLLTNISVFSVADMISRFEASVASAFSTIISSFHLTPVISVGASVLETPAISTPNVRPVSLTKTHSDFVYGVITPAVPVANRSTVDKMGTMDEQSPTKADPKTLTDGSP